MDMPPIDARLTEVSRPDPKATIPENATSVAMPANQHDADQLVDHVGWALVDAEQQVEESHAQDRGSAAAAPARSLRRATARRASTRRATARSRQSDNEASIITFLARHPGSTAGDLAKGLNLNPANVATRLAQLSKAGEIKRAAHGYSTK
jgi:predicted Rossmann fold nucleotide-binding protein DprA/Smf involved in DNA uptake